MSESWHYVVIKYLLTTDVSLLFDKMLDTTNGSGKFFKSMPGTLALIRYHFLATDYKKLLNSEIRFEVTAHCISY